MQAILSTPNEEEFLFEEFPHPNEDMFLLLIPNSTSFTSELSKEITQHF